MIVRPFWWWLQLWDNNNYVCLHKSFRFLFEFCLTILVKQNKTMWTDSTWFQANLTQPKQPWWIPHGSTISSIWYRRPRTTTIFWTRLTTITTTTTTTATMATAAATAAEVVWVEIAPLEEVVVVISTPDYFKSKWSLVRFGSRSAVVLR